MRRFREWSCDVCYSRSSSDDRFFCQHPRTDPSGFGCYNDKLCADCSEECADCGETFCHEHIVFMNAGTKLIPRCLACFKKMIRREYAPKRREMALPLAS